MKKQWKWILTAVVLVAVLLIATLLYRSLSDRYASTATTAATAAESETALEETTDAVEETDSADETDVSGQTAADEDLLTSESAAAQTETAQATQALTEAEQTTTTKPSTTLPSTTQPSTTKPTTTLPTTTAPAIPTAAPGEVFAPDFVVYDGNHAQTNLSDHFGKPLVVNFWASWCGPCCSELPAFDAAARENADSIEFMMVNMTDGYETVDKASNFIRSSGYSFPVYYDVDENAASVYNVRSIPLTVFIRPDGSVMAMRTGAMDAATLQSYLALLQS